MEQIRDAFPNNCSQQAEIYFITELFNSRTYKPITDPEPLIAKVQAYFDNLRDVDLKCGISNTAQFS
jgi:hypothetical protein